MSAIPLETLFDLSIAIACGGASVSLYRLVFNQLKQQTQAPTDERGDEVNSSDQLSSAILREAIEHTAGGLIICDAQQLDLPIVYVSPSFESLTGYLATEVLGRSYRFLQGQETEQAGIAAITKAVASGTACKVLLQIYRKNGRPFWGEVAFSPIVNADGKVTHYVSTQSDISHYLSTFKALQESEARYRQLYEETPAMLHSVDASGQIVGTSNYWLEKLGYEREDVIGRSLLDFVADECKQNITQATTSLTKNSLDRNRPCQFIKKDGSHVDVLLSTTPESDEAGCNGSVLGVLVDITERKQAQRKLNRSSALLRAINDLPPTGIFVMDCHTNEALFVNSEFYRIWQLEHLQAEVNGGSINGEELLTACLSNIDLGRFVADSTGKDFTRGNKTIEDEVPLLDGRTLRRIYGPVQQNDTTFAYLYMFEDITERKQAVQALACATKAAESANLAKSEFLANMSHELRSPLNAILGFTHVLKESNPEPEQAESLDIIHSSGEHLLTLINDILDISKIEAGRVELTYSEFDLYCLIDELQQMFGSTVDKKGVRFLVVRSQNLPQIIFSDRLKLRQILINLLSNAIKFTASGTITLSVDSQDSDQDSGVKARDHIGPGINSPTAGKTTTLLTFAVKDTGSGIAAADQPRLFEAFVQTQSGLDTHDGTGLGLAISNEYIQLLGGALIVDSALGVGSTFSFDVSVAVVDNTLSLSAKTEGAAKRVTGLASGQLDYRILVVDDVAINRKLISHLLTNVGFEVREAENGKEAIARWESWQPHLIWMDIRMPVMTGEEATTRIKTLEKTSSFNPHHQTRIIALTANAFAEDKAAAIASGCDDFVSKPIRANEIFDKLAEHLNVRYQYADSSTATSQSAIPALTPALFENTSDTWRYELTQAILDLDDDAILSLLSQLSDEQKPLVLAIRASVKNLSYKKLLDTIESSRLSGPQS